MRVAAEARTKNAQPRHPQTIRRTKGLESHVALDCTILDKWEPPPTIQAVPDTPSESRMFQISKLTWRDSIRTLRCSRCILVRAASELLLSRLDEIARFELYTAGAPITPTSAQRQTETPSQIPHPTSSHNAEHRRDYSKHSLGARHHGSL